MLRSLGTPSSGSSSSFFARLILTGFPPGQGLTHGRSERNFAGASGGSDLPPNSVVTLGVLTVSVKAGFLSGCAPRRVRLARSYLNTLHIHASRDLRNAFQPRRLTET